MHDQGHPPPRGVSARDKGCDEAFRFYFDLEASVYSPELPKLLGELESVGIVRRVVYDTIPMKTEYFLTPLGESLVPIIRMMDAWGNEHREMFDEMGNLNTK